MTESGKFRPMLYGKFRATFKSGTKKRRIFRVTFDDLMSSNIDLPKSKLNTVLYIFFCTGRQKMHQIAQICTYIFTNFPGLTPHAFLYPPSERSEWRR